MLSAHLRTKWLWVRVQLQCYSLFDIKIFKADLDENLKSNNANNLSDFQNILRFNENVTLIWRTKKDYFQNLSVKDLSDNRKIWKTIQPYFSNKGFNRNKMLYKEKSELVSRRKTTSLYYEQVFHQYCKKIDFRERSG